MNSREYERRRRAIEEQLQADLDLIRAGHEAKLRALETVWLSSPAGDPAEAGETARSETPLSETDPSETPRSETPPGAPARARRRGGVLADVRAVLPRLPEVFEREDLIQSLGYRPPRATLYRALAELQQEKEIQVVRAGDERNPARYRRRAGG